MAAKTITFDAGEWIYIDNEGIPHTVTTSQTLEFNMVDGGAADVKYHLTAGQVLTTTDGYRLYMAPSENTGYIGTLTDAGQGAAKRAPIGDWEIRDPKTHEYTRWRASSFNEDDADTPTEITATFESVKDPTKTFTWTAVSVA